MAGFYLFFNKSPKIKETRLFFTLLISLSIFLPDFAFGSTTINVGTTPFQVSVNSNTNMIYTANQGSNDISVINGTTNTVTATIPVGSGPVGVAVDLTTNRIYAGNIFSGTVSVIDGSTNTVVDTVSVGSIASRLDVNSITNKIYVTNSFSNTLFVIDGTTDTFTNTITVGNGPVEVAVDEITNLIYTANRASNGVSVINGSTNTVITTIPVANGPNGIAVDSSDSRAYVSNFFSNTLTVIDTLTNTAVASIPVGTGPGGVDVNTNTKIVYVGNRQSNSVTAIDVSVGTPPSANAGPDQTIDEETFVTLSGSGIGSGPLSFTWTQTAGPAVSLSNASTANPTFTAPQVTGTTILTFQLVVNDGTFDSVPDTVNVVVRDVTIFTVPLLVSNGTLAGNVTVGDIASGTTITLLFTTPPNVLPSAELLQQIVPSGTNGNNIAFNFTVDSLPPSSLPPLPLSSVLFFDVNFQGINFSNPANFPPDLSPNSKFLVDRNFETESKFTDGCPVVSFLLLNENNDWEQLGDPLNPNTYKIYTADSAAGTVSIINGFTNTVEKTITLAGGAHEVVYNSNLDNAYVTNPLSSSLTIIDGTTDAIEAIIPVGIAPIGVDVDSINNKIYVVNRGSNSVTVIDSSTNNVLATVPVGSGPIQVDADPSTNRAYVVNFFSNNVSVIDGATNTVISTIPVGFFPSGVAVDPSNKAYVANFASNTVSVIDGLPGSPTENTVIKTIAVGSNPATVGIDPSSNRAYVANTVSDDISVIDRSQQVVINTIPVGDGPIVTAINQNTNRIYVTNQVSNDVSVIDGTTNTVLDTIQVGSGPIGISLNPNVPNPARDPSTDVIDSGSGQILKCGYVGKQPHLSKFAVGGIIRPILAILGSSGGQTAAPTIDLTNMASNGLLPDSIKTQVLNHDPFKPIPPSNETGFDFPFYLGGDGYVIGGFTNTIVTKTESTGIPVEIKLNIPSSSLTHVALYTNLRGDARSIDDSDTFIIYEKGQPLQIVDPNGYFGDVKFDLSKDGIKNTLTLKIIFLKPMEKSDIDLRMWDAQRSSSETKILDAWQVIATPEPTTQSQTEINSVIQDTPPTSPNNSDKVIDLIKMWSGYSPNSISDSELLGRMGFEGNHIPAWFTKTTKWVVSGETSEQEFVEAIKFMSENGIIK